MRHPLLLLACAAAVLGGCSVDVQGTRSAVVREDKRFPVSAHATVTLRTFDGSIEVRGWERDEVLVQIERRATSPEVAQTLEVTTTQEGNRIAVEAREPATPDSSASVSLVVSVPRGVTLTARSADGSIRMSGVEGVLAGYTGDGSIRIDGARGSLDVESGDGSISASGRLGRLRAHSGDGSVQITAEPGSVMQGDWSITTGDGSVSLRLPDAFDAELAAESGDGAISVSPDLMRGGITAERGDGPARAVAGTLGKGGRRLVIRSGDGSVSIAAR